MKTVNQHKFMPLILSVCMLVPMSIDIFIPGLPAIQSDFIGQNVSLVMGMSLLGLMLSQLIYGPLLDRYGRKPIIATGLLIFTLASIAIIFANTFLLLILARFIQAFGGSAAVVGVIAITKDIYPKEQLLSKIGMILAMIGISPIIAPLIGSVANYIWGWRGSFGILVILGIFYTLVIMLLLKETIHEKNYNALNVKSILTNYINLLKTPAFIAYCFSSGFTYCILFSYLNISSFIIINEMGFQMMSYGAIVAVNAVAIIIMARVSHIIVNKIGLNKTIYCGITLIILGGLLMLLINLFTKPTILTFMLPVFITTIGAGIIRPTANGGAMQIAPKQSIGSAASCFNFISFGSGAIVSIFSLEIIHTIPEFGVFILTFGCLSALLMLLIFYIVQPNQE